MLDCVVSCVVQKYENIFAISVPAKIALTYKNANAFVSLYITLNRYSYFVGKISYFGALFVKSTMFRPVTCESWSITYIFM